MTVIAECLLEPFSASLLRRGLLETPGMVPSAMPTLVTLPDVEVIILDNKQRLLFVALVTCVVSPSAILLFAIIVFYCYCI